MRNPNNMRRERNKILKGRRGVHFVLISLCAGSIFVAPTRSAMLAEAPQARGGRAVQPMHPPIVFIANACGMSTMVYQMFCEIARELKAGRPNLCFYGKELTKPDRMEDALRKIGQKYTNNISAEIRKLHLDSVGAGRRLLFFFFHEAGKQVDIVETLKALNSKISIIRRNILDTAICRKRDCFGKNSPASVTTYMNGSQVPNEDCFHARRFANEPIVVRIVDPAAFRSEFDTARKNEINWLKSYGIKKGTPVVSPEDLGAFQYENEPGALMTTSIKAWSLLWKNSFDETPDRQLLRKVLIRLKGGKTRKDELYSARIYREPKQKKRKAIEDMVNIFGFKRKPNSTLMDWGNVEYIKMNRHGLIRLKGGKTRKGELYSAQSTASRNKKRGKRKKTEKKKKRTLKEMPSRHKSVLKRPWIGVRKNCEA